MSQRDWMDWMDGTLACARCWGGTGDADECCGLARSWASLLGEMGARDVDAGSSPDAVKRPCLLHHGP